MPAEYEEREGGSRCGSPFLQRESMGANAAWRVTDFVLRASSSFIWLVSRTTGESRVGNCVGFNSDRFGLLDFIPDGIFASKSGKVEVWFQLECAPEQLVSVVTANRHFYVATFFMWSPNLIICYLNMYYFRMIWTFAFGKCYSRGALDRFFVVLILIGTRAVLIMKVSSGVNVFMRWVFNICLYGIFLLMVFAC